MSGEFERGWKDGKNEAWWDNFFDGVTEASKEAADFSLKIITFGLWKNKQKQKELPPSRKDIVIDVKPNVKKPSNAEKKGGYHA